MSFYKQIQVQESTLEDALKAGFDLVQYKYRGIFCRCVVTQGNVWVFNAADESLHAFQAPQEGGCCVLIGDYIGPPQSADLSIMVYDCWKLCSRDNPDYVGTEWANIKSFTYHDRFAFVRQQVSLIGAPLIAVKNYPINMAPILWDSPLPNTCGLVYRRSSDQANAGVRIVRQYRELPRSLP